MTFYLEVVGGLFVAWFILVVLFAPHIPYHVERPLDASSEHFIRVLESACLVALEDGNHLEVFTDGPQFYPAMLDAIRSAREAVNMECYIFQNGDIGGQFVDALVERANAGVQVRLVLDAIGSFGGMRSATRRLCDAGCRVEQYQFPFWYRLHRLNNRTHRELLVVDGRVAFVGGAGVADWWHRSIGREARWRDMMVRVTGPVVAQIQGVAAENWLECSGEIQTGPEVYKTPPAAGSVPAFALRSSPSDRATASRVLFQTVVESASTRCRISTPYFLPDKAFRHALARTAARGVPISVVVPGPKTDQKLVRYASRRLYGDLLKAGVRIFEYRPGMIHVKMLIVDDLWSVVGTTNFDNRSFEHNDEVNLVARDAATARRLSEDHERDITNSREITLRMWKRRPLVEKLVGSVVWMLERQQ
ncbi:MAG: phospholipase D-like domain-containing protein [Vicinamibacterales bacterium]